MRDNPLDGSSAVPPKVPVVMESGAPSEQKAVPNGGEILDRILIEPSTTICLVPVIGLEPPAAAGVNFLDADKLGLLMNEWIVQRLVAKGQLQYVGTPSTPRVRRSACEHAANVVISISLEPQSSGEPYAMGLRAQRGAAVVQFRIERAGWFHLSPEGFFDPGVKLPDGSLPWSPTTDVEILLSQLSDRILWAD